MSVQGNRRALWAVILKASSQKVGRLLSESPAGRHSVVYSNGSLLSMTVENSALAPVVVREPTGLSSDWRSTRQHGRARYHACVDGLAHAYVWPHVHALRDRAYV